MKILTANGLRIAVLDDAGAALRNEQDALDLIATLGYEHQADHLILPAALLDSAFFDLRSGLAGAMLQKFVNYRLCVAIVGDFSTCQSKAFRQFMLESNRGGHVHFCAGVKEALAAFGS